MWFPGIYLFVIIIIIVTGTSEMIRESYTARKVITPSLVQLPGSMIITVICNSDFLRC